MSQEFKQKKYQVIKNAISYDLANFIFNYQLLRRDAVKFMYEKILHIIMVTMELGKIHKFQMYIPSMVIM